MSWAGVAGIGNWPGVFTRTERRDGDWSKAESSSSKSIGRFGLHLHYTEQPRIVFSWGGCEEFCKDPGSPFGRKGCMWPMEERMRWEDGMGNRMDGMRLERRHLTQAVVPGMDGCGVVSIISLWSLSTKIIKPPPTHRKAT